MYVKIYTPNGLLVGATTLDNVSSYDEVAFFNHLAMYFGGNLSVRDATTGEELYKTPAVGE